MSPPEKLTRRQLILNRFPFILPALAALISCDYSTKSQPHHPDTPPQPQKRPAPPPKENPPTPTINYQTNIYSGFLLDIDTLYFMHVKIITKPVTDLKIIEQYGKHLYRLIIIDLANNGVCAATWIKDTDRNGVSITKREITLHRKSYIYFMISPGPGNDDEIQSNIRFDPLTQKPIFDHQPA